MSASRMPTCGTRRCPGQRQIDRHGGLADAALAARHRDDILDARQGFRCAAPRAARSRLLSSSVSSSAMPRPRRCCCRAVCSVMGVAQRRKAELDARQHAAALRARAAAAPGLPQRLAAGRIDVALDGRAYARAQTDWYRRDGLSTPSHGWQKACRIAVAADMA